MGWSRGSLPTDALLRIANDNDPQRIIGREIIKLCWEWEIDVETMDQIRTISLSVLSRSASLVAASLCATAKANNGLVPALEASVVAVSGKLFNSSSLYRLLVRQKVNVILVLSRLLIIEPVR